MTAGLTPVLAQSARERPGWRLALPISDLVALSLVAAVARTFNLGTFSLWLDEVLLMTRAQGSPAEVWAACRANAEHPPLSALAMAALNGLGLSDHAHRLLPIALGVATVLLLAAWTGWRFGRPAGMVTGLVTALLPFHVRYSQELRPYPYLIFFAVLALVTADLLEIRSRTPAAVWILAALLGGFYSHYLFPLALVPAMWLLVERALAGDRERRRNGRRALVTFVVIATLALLAFLPWLLAVARELAGRSPAGGATTWTWWRALYRWQFLTTAGVEGDPLNWAGALALALALLGALAIWRQCAGRAVIAGAVAGIVGAELFYATADHWSQGRYDAVGCVFLPVLMGTGIARLGSFRRTRWIAVALAGALFVGELAGLARYARVGRSHWDRVADVIRQQRRPGEPILVENEWTRLSLGYYLQGRRFLLRTRKDGAPVVVGGEAPWDRLWPPGRSALLVLAGRPKQRSLRLGTRPFPVVARFPLDRVRVFLVDGGEGRRRLLAGVLPAAQPAPSPPPLLDGRQPLYVAPLPPPSWLERVGRALELPRTRRSRADSVPSSSADSP